MTIAVRTARTDLAGATAAATLCPKPVRLLVCTDLPAAEAHWERLTAARALATPYQTFAWVTAWHRHVSGPAGMTPLIVVGLDDHGSPLFLLPLVTHRKFGLKIAGFFGGDHANINMALWRRDLAAEMTAADVRTMLSDVGAQHGIDLFLLRHQPFRWTGRANPFALLPHQLSDELFPLEFNGANGEQVLKHCLKPAMRSRLRTKERKLQALAGYRYVAATTPEQVDHYLNAFLTQKAAHFRAQGIHNVFADPGIESFLRASCHDGLASGKPIIELHALECDSEVITVFGGVGDGRRFSCMFNSYTMSENGRWSPGLIILTHVVAHYGDARFASFDLGLGYAHYKTFFCKQAEPMFDSFIPASFPGTLAAFALRASYHLKYWIKSSNLLRDALARLRRMTSHVSD